jgi:hypothetical protein
MVKHRSGTRWWDDREVGWHCMRSAPCTRRRGAHVSWFGLKTKFDDLSVVWPQNQVRRFVSGLASKPLGRVSRFGPQNRQLRFGDLGLKIITKVSWFEPQNQAGYSLSVVPQNQWEDEDGAGHASRSSGLLHLEVSQARVSQSGLNTGGSTARMVHVASLWRLRRVKT